MGVSEGHEQSTAYASALSDLHTKVNRGLISPWSVRPTACNEVINGTSASV